MIKFSTTIYCSRGCSVFSIQMLSKRFEFFIVIRPDGRWSERFRIKYNTSKYTRTHTLSHRARVKKNMIFFVIFHFRLCLLYGWTKNLIVGKQEENALEWDRMENERCLIAVHSIWKIGYLKSTHNRIGSSIFLCRRRCCCRWFILSETKPLFNKWIRAYLSFELEHNYYLGCCGSCLVVAGPLQNGPMSKTSAGK